MNSTQQRFFFGCMLTDTQGDRMLGIKSELVSANGRSMAAELYDGARENFRCVLGNRYTHVFDDELFIGDFLQGEDDGEGMARIQQHLTSCLRADRFNQRRLCLYRLSCGEEGGVEAYEQIAKLRKAEAGTLGNAPLIPGRHGAS